MYIIKVDKEGTQKVIATLHNAGDAKLALDIALQYANQHNIITLIDINDA